MAIVTAFFATEIPSPGIDGDISDATTTSFVISDGDNTGTYFGSFSVSGSNIVSGTIESFEFEFEETLTTRVTDLDVSFADFASAYGADADGSALAALVFGGDDKFNGSDEADIFTAYNGNDNLSGKRGQDELFGGGGSDILKGGRAKDILYGGTGSDELYGGKKGDELYGEKGADLLRGNAGFDELYGLKGNDSLYGGNGNDILDGGVDDDFLDGGSGSDTFVFADGFGDDVIADMQGADVIDLQLVTNITSFNDLKNNHLEQEGADAVITSSAGNTITIENTDINDLTSDNFSF